MVQKWWRPCPWHTLWTFLSFSFPLVVMTAMLQHCAGLPRCCGADNTHSACWPMNSQTTKDQQKNVNSTCSLLVGKHLGGDTCLLMGPYGAMHGTAQKPLIPSWDHESRHTPHLCEPCRTTATTRAKTAATPGTPDQPLRALQDNSNHASENSGKPL